MSRAACLICGGPLEQPATGRPPDYCQPACRRSAEYARRRLQRQLDSLETYARNLRLMGAPKRQLDRVQGEIDAATARLLALLGGQPAPVSPPSPAGRARAASEARDTGLAGADGR